MNTRLSKSAIILIMICFTPRVSARPVWPILATDDPNHYNTVNCTFGEIHPTNGDHFHLAIDIDCTNANVPVRPIENGVVINRNCNKIICTN